MSEDRLVSAVQGEEDANFDMTLRPRRLEQFVGQEKIKSNLSVFINAAKSRGEALDHVLLKGAPGLGKTTIANIIANELDVPIRVTSGPAIERPGDLAAILTNMQEGSVLFIDEIHRLGRVVEEILYPAMEDFKIDIVIGKGPGARSIRLDLPRFTIVGATTRAGLLTGPLRDRFGIVHDFEFYSVDALRLIIRRSASLLECEIAPDAEEELGGRSRGTPRIANRLLRRTRDFMSHLSKKSIDLDVVQFALQQLEIDESGLDRIDRSILSCIVERFNGGPVGVETLAATISEDSGTVEEMYEPYLIQQGFIHRTPRGRVAGELAYKALGVPFTKSAGDLFNS
ncbi:MAG: Holliday junction branch migration DNA helicase RuvB [Fimbriimonadales bacterium]|nr:Holliday junction branch migration DNA helicase RuvB [Fimbriimonadales bacterium]